MESRTEADWDSPRVGTLSGLRREKNVRLRRQLAREVEKEKGPRL